MKNRKVKRRINKTKLFKNKTKNIKYKRRIISHQKLDFTGHLMIMLDIYDSDGHYTRQVGESEQTDFKHNFEIAFDQAYMNAIYKHYFQTGTRVIKTPDDSVQSMITRVKVIKWNIRYDLEQFSNEKKPPYTVKNFIMRGKRYTDIRYKGVLQSRTKYQKVSKKEFNNLISERTSN